MKPRGENVEYDKLRDRYDALRAELADCQEEENRACELVQRQGDLLRGVVNALRGEPPEDTLWSHHDAPLLAQAATQKIAALRQVLRQILPQLNPKYMKETMDRGYQLLKDDDK